MEQVKLKLGMQLDDAHFRQMLLDTQVLMTNNYTKWQWDKLYELFQGPLMNQKRLDESIKGDTIVAEIIRILSAFKKQILENQEYKGLLLHSGFC